MREAIIQFLKSHPSLTRFIWKQSKLLMQFFGRFVPVQPKTMLFCSFGGRRFDDSPKAIYEEVCQRSEFNDWRLIWAFVSPSLHDIPRGEKIKIDTYQFFKILLSSRVWVSNSGMDRGIGLKRKCTLKVETWHGTPLKKIGGDEHQNSLSINSNNMKGQLDSLTIRCAQSEYDREILARIMHSEKDSFLLCDLPRNDGLLKYDNNDVLSIKQSLNIPVEKKVILYAPTYREYLINEAHKTYLAPPIHLEKWEKELGNEYVLLVRAHYAVSTSLNIHNISFVKDVSDYPFINDLYIISDVLLSDYSSCYIDFSILDRPMLCFAYDLEEYEEKRGLYMDLEEVLPCTIDKDEDTLLCHIKTLDFDKASELSKQFHNRFAPNAGNASKTVVDVILSRL